MINIAYAQQAGGDTAGALGAILPLILIFALFYFMLILPQQRKTKRHKQMLNALEKGAEVVTVGGILGRVVEIHDSFITLDTGENRLTFQKQSIQTLLPKGTIDGI